MENLVSHEAMVNEIKNLCWDNRYHEGMTVEHLAEELDALAEDFDPYEYRDNLLDEDNYIDEIIYDLNDGRYINEYIEFLQLVAEEDEDNSVVAEILMDYLKKYKKGSWDYEDNLFNSNGKKWRNVGSWI